MICFAPGTIVSFSLILIVIVLISIGMVLNYISSMRNTIVTVQTPAPIITKDNSRNNTDFPSRDFIQQEHAATNVGYVFNGMIRFPLFEQRENREYYYYILDDSRNGVKIPIETKNKRDQLYDSDIIVVPELGGDLTVKLYDVSRLQYNNFFS
jgi:hypothetical protein